MKLVASDHSGVELGDVFEVAATSPQRFERASAELDLVMARQLAHCN
jgi:hypothetical protein